MKAMCPPTMSLWQLIHLGTLLEVHYGDNQDVILFHDCIHTYIYTYIYIYINIQTVIKKSVKKYICKKYSQSNRKNCHKSTAIIVSNSL